MVVSKEYVREGTEMLIQCTLERGHFPPTDVFIETSATKIRTTNGETGPCKLSLQKVP
jgi:hypothetical protein